jgi:hypothetical protein
MFKQGTSTEGRTYFLITIAKDEEIRYSVPSSVISCLKMCATSFAKFNAKTRDMFCRKAQKTRVTSFARPVHNANKSYETGCKADVKRASDDIARIPSREIVPRGRIFPSFLPSHRRSQLLLSVAFASIPGNGEGPALRDQAGTISREAVMFLLPFCLVAWLEGPPVRLIC